MSAPAARKDVALAKSSAADVGMALGKVRRARRCSKYAAKRVGRARATIDFTFMEKYTVHVGTRDDQT